MPNDNVQRGEKLLNRLQAEGALTSGGKNWLIPAIDPFHDTATRCDGYPDVNVAPSVVQLVKKSVTISHPNPTAGGTWSCNVFNLPWVNDEDMVLRGVQGNLIYSDLQDGSATFGGVVALGQTQVAGESITFKSAQSIQCCTVEESYLRGSARVIAAGFEVTNTTAPINQSGQVAVYRQPQEVLSPASYSLLTGGYNAGSMAGTGSYAHVRPPPATLSDAMLLTGTRTWHAKYGSYNVITLNTLNLPADGDAWCDAMIQSDLTNAENEQTYAWIPALRASPATSTSYILGPSMMALCPFNMSGAYYTGLSADTTLVLTANFYIERFPSRDEADLVTLARPSPGYCARAFELYTAALSDMPAGVPVSENGLGQWFADTVSKVGRFLAPALSAIPHPIGKAAGAIVGGASTIATTFAAPPNAKLDVRRNERRPKAAQEGISASSHDAAQDRRISALEKRTSKLSHRPAAQPKQPKQKARPSGRRR
jgi:hypothetical protein